MTITSAVAYLQSLPIDAPGALIDTKVEIDAPTGHDLLVEVKAVSVNPVDIKVRKNTDPGGTPKVLGYDAAGVVTAIGPEVAHFSVGDEVFYAGSITRPGTNSALHLVDERIVGNKPRSLDFAQAAAMPLTTITAWETLFTKLKLDANSTGTLLVVAGAGGVGSVLIQIARHLTKLDVIATASRPESIKWAYEMGANEVVDHHDLVNEVLRVAPDGVDYIFTPFSTGNVEVFAEVLKVRGEIVAIDDPDDLNIRPLKTKSQTWHWELMFTRPMFEPESTYQHELLNEVARLVDAGAIRTTMNSKLAGLNAKNMIEAHRQVESSSTIGKVVLEV